jgi:hypothetical protein
MKKKGSTPLLSIVEVAVLIGLILLIIWGIQPLGRAGLDLGLYLLAALMLIAAPAWHRDSRVRLGLRLDNFWTALAGVLPITLVAAGAMTGVGLYLATIDLPFDPMRELAVYVAWAAIQQYALQSFVLVRLEDAGLRAGSPAAAAALFSLVHAPNLNLMILTFLGALFWCSSFRRQPNVFAVALSHAVLALAAVSTLPLETTGGLRVGPRYWSG